MTKFNLYFQLVSQNFGITRYRSLSEYLAAHYKEWRDNSSWAPFNAITIFAYVTSSTVLTTDYNMYQKAVNERLEKEDEQDFRIEVTRTALDALVYRLVDIKRIKGRTGLLDI